MKPYASHVTVLSDRSELPNKRRESRLPLIEWSYQSTEHPAIGSKSSHEFQSPSIGNLRRQFFATELPWHSAIEFVVLALLTATSGWGLFAMLEALREFLR